MWVRLVPSALALLVLTGCATAPEASQASPAPAEATSPESGAASPRGQDRETPVADTPEPTAPVLAPSGPFAATEVVLESGPGEEVTVAVHVAADPSTRALGLMHREDVPAGTGMLFLFPKDSTGGFWMKNTLVPLSIAFAAADGRILRILDMEPCAADPCPVYDPGTAYRMALEVPAGDFDRLGVSEGDRIVVPAGLPPAR